MKTKQTINSLIIFITMLFVSCVNSCPREGDFKKSITNVSDTTKTYELKNEQEFKLTDAIISDFNGDKKLDTAKFQLKNNKAGVIITDGLTHKETIIGCGNKFDETGWDDFKWVDYWGITNDTLTYNVIVKDDEIIGTENFHLDNPSIFLRDNEAGGGIITYKNGKYMWVHQAD